MSGFCNCIKGVTMSDEIQKTCCDCSAKGIGYACYVPAKYNVCCDNKCCLALQCRLDWAVCCPQLCDNKWCPVCIKCCTTNECDCGALGCPDWCKYCGLCATQKCADIDCAECECCKKCEVCFPWCKFCAACAAQDCNACIELHPPQCDACCPPCKMCCGPDLGQWCAYRFTWFPQWCCCKNSGCLVACPLCPSITKNYCTCCNDMNDTDKKYNWGGLPPPHGNGGMPTIRGPQGPPTSFFGGESEITPAKA